MSCTTTNDVVGTKNVSIWAANRTTPVVLPTFMRAITPVCVPGYYGTNGLYCAPCPVGASCPGGETSIDRVTASAGFWRVAPSQLRAENCPPQRQDNLLSFCAYAVACSPNASCLAGNICAAGYVGDRCSLCDDGFYRTNGSCAVCPTSPLTIVIVLVLLALGALGVSYILNKYDINLTLIAIGVDWAQVRGAPMRFE